MKIKTGYILRTIAGQYMAVPVGKRVNDLHGIIALNETGAFIWKLLENEISDKELADALTAEYEISLDDAIIAVRDYLEMMQKEGVLEDNS